MHDHLPLPGKTLVGVCVAFPAHWARLGRRVNKTQGCIHWDKRSLGYHLVSVSAFQKERRTVSLRFADRVKDAECPLHQPHAELGAGKPLGWSQGHKVVSCPWWTVTTLQLGVSTPQTCECLQQWESESCRLVLRQRLMDFWIVSRVLPILHF